MVRRCLPLGSWARPAAGQRGALMSLIGRALAAVSRFLHPRSKDDYLMEVQWDPYVESIVYRVSVDCE